MSNDRGSQDVLVAGVGKRKRSCQGFETGDEAIANGPILG